MSENEYLEPEETATQTNAAEMEEETDNETGRKSKSFSHTVRHKDGGTVTINNYSMAKAIKLWCSECEGFETDPRQCDYKLCPFYPYKGITQANRIRTTYRKPSQEQIEKLKAGLAKFRAAKNGKAENNQDTGENL